MADFGPYAFGWRYRVTSGSIDASQLQNNTDDSAFSAGQGGFGAGGLGPPRIANTVWPTFNGSILYARITIDESWSGAQIWLNYDDDIDVYVNDAHLYHHIGWTGGIYILAFTLPTITGPCAFAAGVHDGGGGASYFDMHAISGRGAWAVG